MKMVRLRIAPRLSVVCLILVCNSTL